MFNLALQMSKVGAKGYKLRDVQERTSARILSIELWCAASMSETIEDLADIE